MYNVHDLAYEIILIVKSNSILMTRKDGFRVYKDQK